MPKKCSGESGAGLDWTQAILEKHYVSNHPILSSTGDAMSMASFQRSGFTQGAAVWIFSVLLTGFTWAQKESTPTLESKRRLTPRRARMPNLWKKRNLPILQNGCQRCLGKHPEKPKSTKEKAAPKSNCGHHAQWIL